MGEDAYAANKFNLRAANEAAVDRTVGTVGVARGITN